jgi:aldehyde:ferredoxin oxidoreductase
MSQSNPNQSNINQTNLSQSKLNQSKLFGQLLTIDLGASQCKYLPYPDQAFDCLGGRGFNVWYLYHHLAPGTGPMDTENILMFSGGFLTGSSAPTASRLHINALSPLTGILGSSNIGGYAGAWLRSCNLSSIVVKGKSEVPVYLYINDNGAEIRNAKELWGKDAFETQDQLKLIHENEKVRILTIGPAGENLVPFAAIMTEKDHAAGRTGMGTVMGSKHLKAIVIARGSHKHFPADTPIRKQAVKTYASNIRAASEFKVFSKYGGAGYINWVNDFGIMGSKNYGQIGMDNIKRIDGKQLEKHVTRTSGCFKCPVQCKADLILDKTKPEQISTRPEFEPIINLGAKCGLDDMNAIIRLDNLCTRLGLDSTSAASAIAFAMDMNEKGLLPKEFTQDQNQDPKNPKCQNPKHHKLDLSWGNAETMEKLLYQMVENKGLGKLLRLGVKKAALIMGEKTQKYAAHVKGLELTGYHPGAIMGTALGYAVSSRGGDYNNVYASLEYSWSKEEAKKEFGTIEAVNIKSIKAKGFLIKKAVIANILIDSLGLCKVPVLSLLISFNLENEIQLINELTGLKVSRESLFQTGEKIAGLEKWFNICHGKEDMEDRLPDMFFPDDKNNIQDDNDNDNKDRGLTRKNFKTMLDEYYLAMGWDKNGIPPKPEYIKI